MAPRGWHESGTAGQGREWVALEEGPHGGSTIWVQVEPDDFGWTARAVAQDSRGKRYRQVLVMNADHDAAMWHADRFIDRYEHGAPVHTEVR